MDSPQKYRNLAASLLFLGGCQAFFGSSSASEDGDISSSDTNEEGAQTSENDDSTSDGADIDESTFYLARRLDILFVIDNSESMAEEQGLLSESIDRFFEVLDYEQVSYRLAITSTDDGRSFYGACGRTDDTESEGIAGHFQSTSCLDRLDDFQSPDGEDLSYVACRRNCKYTTEELGFLPTNLASASGENRERPWLQRIAGLTNLNPEISMTDAFACLAPVGINGCGFEQQLRSQYLALEHTEDSETAEFGFRRPKTPLLIVHVTDEADCSTADTSIFDPKGDRVFWAGGSELSSFICWTAGVDCTQDGNCEAQDHDQSGNATDDLDAAVLFPLEDFINQSEEQDTKLWGSKDHPQMTTMALIGGVEGNGKHANVKYPNVANTDYGFHSRFGVGKGCESKYVAPTDPDLPTDNEMNGEDPTENQFAIPPVRIREIAEHYGANNLFSICEPDFSPALRGTAYQAFADLPSFLGPQCYPKPVRDQDPSTELLEASCEFRSKGSSEVVRIKECLKENDDKGGTRYIFDKATRSYQIPNGEDFCHLLVVDPDGTLSEDPYDNMSVDLYSGERHCPSLGLNLEVRFTVRPGVEIDPDQRVQANCVAE